MPPMDVDKALTLPPDECVEHLLQLPENQWYDRKSGRIKPSQLAEALVAMANAEGGIIAVGLHDGEVDGVSDKHENDLRRTPLDFTSPMVQVTLQEINSSQGRVLVFQVQPGEFVHETHRGECFQRIGDRDVELLFRQRQELEWERPTSTFEGNTRLLNLTVDALDDRQLRSYQRILGSESPLRALYARDLIAEDEHITVAAYLLFAERPQMHFPSAYVRVLKYAEDDRGAGRFQNLIDGADVRCEGSIPNQIHTAESIIEELIPKRRALGERGRFEGIPIIPKDAWLEGLVNAVVHRSYSDAGDHIRVELFPGRIEISNPGRFLGTNRLDKPESITRRARNPRIARVCHDVGITQELGEGIRRMFAEMRSLGLSDPIYDQHQNTVKLTLLASNAVSQDILEPLGAKASLILDTLRKAQQPLGTGQIAELLGIARPTILRHIRKLEEAGLVTWHGDSPRDPRATWRLN